MVTPLLSIMGRGSSSIMPTHDSYDPEGRRMPLREALDADALPAGEGVPVGTDVGKQ